MPGGSLVPSDRVADCLRGSANASMEDSVDAVMRAVAASPERRLGRQPCAAMFVAD